MPRKRNKHIPSYRYHRARGLAVVTLDGRDVYLGPYGSVASKAEYDRAIAEWLSNGRRLPPNEDDDSRQLTITELIAAYWQYAAQYYVKDGRPTSEQDWIKYAMRPVRRLYGRTRAADFGPLALRTVMQVMIEEGATRTAINGRIARIRRMFKWAVSLELVPTTVYRGLQTVTGLRRGRTTARETRPVQPVPEIDVEATKPFVSRQVCAMIELQQLTGMRPGEVVNVRGVDVDTTGCIWQYHPESHKTAHHGHRRIIDLGPRAQAVIRPFLKPDLEAFLFSPADAEAERHMEQRMQRKTPVQPSQRNRRKKRPKRPPLDRYSVDSYRRAIARGCDRAFPPPEELPEDEMKAWRKQHRWHPHQLRHSYATRIRREHGLEAARILLGHRSMAVTEVYAEIDRMKVAGIVAATG